MKKLMFNGSFGVIAVCIAVAVFQEKWGTAIWMTHFLVLIELDQIHKTIKAAHAKGDV